MWVIEPATERFSAVLSVLLLAWFAVSCVLASLVDIKSRRIPNAFVAMCALGACLQAVARDLAGLPVLATLSPAGERAAWGIATLVAGAVFEKLWRRFHDGTHGMGYGDIKFASALALWVGPMTPFLVCGACLVAACFALATRRRTVPLGPFLAVSSGACLLVSMTP